MRPRFFLAVSGVVALAAILSLFLMSRPQIQAVTDHSNQPPPPPPPGVGVLGGPLAGLTTSQTGLFNGGYYEFNIKWDPIRGLGPVFTQAGCYTCHGGGNNVITQCTFNPAGVACVDGGSSTVLGTRYGKWNTDGTFNYLDGNGTFPENEGGPVLHGQTVAQFETLTGCSQMNVAASPSGATESGTTVTITTTAPHSFGVGQRTMVTGVAAAGYNGIFTILAIPSSTTYTYTNTVSGLIASGGGTVNNMPREVLPADATVMGNLRSPQLYGLGLIDSIPETTILSNSGVSKGKGITGVANMVPDENGNLHAGRFGQKSTFPDLLQFTAAAFNNELGITNVYFPVQHLPAGLPYPRNCAIDPNSPKDVDGKELITDYQFNEMLAPVAPQPPNGQTIAGKAVFESLGCNLCHLESMTTGPNIKLVADLNGDTTGVIEPLSHATVNLYSDLLLHDMGPVLSGGIPFQPDQLGQATLTEWRTAPLWGLSTRIQVGLLHDNRTSDLDVAIRAHGGEAASVIQAYKALSPGDNANLLAFLNSL